MGIERRYVCEAQFSRNAPAERFGRATQTGRIHIEPQMDADKRGLKGNP